MVRCGICTTEMIYQDEYWRCPVCHTQLWPDEKRIAELQRNQEAKTQAEEHRLKLRWSLSKLKRMPEPGPCGSSSGKSKGSKSCKRRKKKPKPTFKNTYVEI